MVYATHQAPHALRADLANVLGMDANLIRVINPDMGGGFGIKFGCYAEDVVLAALARTLRTPLKWVETRVEHMVATTHGRAQVTGGDDQEGGDALGRDVPGHHARLGGSQHPGRFHVRELFDGQHHRPDDAAAQGYPRDRDGHDDRCQPGPQTGHEQQGQDEGGQRHQDVEDALTDQVRPSAEVATGHTPDESDGVPEQHRADGHEQGDARAEDDPAQHVAPEMVGAQDVPGQRRIANHAVVRGQRVVGRQPVGQHGHRRQQQQQQGADAAER